MSDIMQYREGRVNLTAQWLWAGDDLLVLITGGDRPHIGAVCLAGEAGQRLVASYSKHREDNLAEQMGVYLSARLGRKVVVAAGMHWEDFTPRLLQEIENAWQELARRLSEYLCQTKFYS